MNELLLRYAGILALMACGVLYAKRTRADKRTGAKLATFVTSALFPAYVF